MAVLQAVVLQGRLWRVTSGKGRKEDDDNGDERVVQAWETASKHVHSRTFLMMISLCSIIGEEVMDTTAYEEVFAVLYSVSRIATCACT